MIHNRMTISTSCLHGMSPWSLITRHLKPHLNDLTLPQSQSVIGLLGHNMHVRGFMAANHVDITGIDRTCTHVKVIEV